MFSRASVADSLPACSTEGTDSTAPDFSRFMFWPTKACGLPRNNDTSIWSSEIPGRWARAAMRLSESPERTRTSSPPVAAADGAAGAAPATGGRGGSIGAGREGRDGAAAIGAGAGEGAAAGALLAFGAGAGVMTGAAVAAGACAVRVLGGSNSMVYSRTRRPLAQVASTITSTKGSSTARSLVIRSTERPSARLTTTTCAEGSTALYSTPAAR